MAQLDRPQGICLSPEGAVVIADSGNNRIRKLSGSGLVAPAAGTIVTIAGTGQEGFGGDSGQATNAMLNYPQDLAFDLSGGLLVADEANNRVRRISPSGIITTIAGDGRQMSLGDGGMASSASISVPQSVAVDSQGNLFVAEKLANRVRRVDPQGVITTVAGNGLSGPLGEGGPALAAGMVDPASVAVDWFGRPYFSDLGSDRVRRIEPSGTITTVAGSTRGMAGDGGPAAQAKLNLPHGLAFDRAGRLYIADRSNNRVRVVSPNGEIATAAGGGVHGDGFPAVDAALNAPFRVAVDGAGSLFIGEALGCRVRKVSTDGTITTVVGTGVAGFSGDGGPAVSARLTEPSGLAIDAEGNLLISDLKNHRIRKVFGIAIPPALPQVPSRLQLTVASSVALPGGEAIVRVGYTGSDGAAIGGIAGLVSIRALDAQSTWVPSLEGVDAGQALPGSSVFLTPEGLGQTRLRLTSPIAISPGTEVARLRLRMPTGAPEGFGFEVSITEAQTYSPRGDASEALANAIVISISLPAGDADGNGRLDVMDVVLCLRISLGLYSPVPAAMLKRCDVAPKKTDGTYGDGVVSISDAMRVLRRVVGIETGIWP
ncbi:MAG TPA: hypothetical protein VGN26_23850 [Armatimonadota bacterium]